MITSDFRDVGIRWTRVHLAYNSKGNSLTASTSQIVRTNHRIDEIGSSPISNKVDSETEIRREYGYLYVSSTYRRQSLDSIANVGGRATNAINSAIKRDGNRCGSLCSISEGKGTAANVALDI